MSPRARSTTDRRPLTRAAILATAVALADRDGFDALTMRNLAAELGVEAMSLYHHLDNKEALLDGIVEVVLERINEAVEQLDGPDPAQGWQAAARARMLTAREVLLRHPWAPSLIESRTSISSATIRYFEGLLALLRAGGFSYDLAHHALHALGSRALGFTQELFAPDEVGDEDKSREALSALRDQIPHLVGMLEATAHEETGVLGWCDDQTEFEFGLDVVLDGLEARRAAS